MSSGVYKRKKSSLFKDRTGETKTMCGGVKATIIEYKSKRNITVQFENGVIVKNRHYQNFEKGHIRCPMIYNIKGDYVECVNPNTKSIFLIDREDLEKINYTLWYKQTDRNGYVINGFSEKLHRIIMNAPKGVIIDHINGNTLDNRKCNLRICTHSQNSCNSKRRVDNTSGYKGVTFRKGSKTNKWAAHIGINGVNKALGCYPTPEEAYAAYCKAAKELHGEFANTG